MRCFRQALERASGILFPGISKRDLAAGFNRIRNVRADRRGAGACKIVAADRLLRQLSRWLLWFCLDDKMGNKFPC
jgi:hypothetical protein